MASPLDMIVVLRLALRRVTIVVSMRSCSSEIVANSGTAFNTAVDTVVAIAETPPWSFAEQW
ncbi:MAG: hypothetical protein ACJ8DP_11375 [Microvirga sp.]